MAPQYPKHIQAGCSSCRPTNSVKALKNITTTSSSSSSSDEVVMKWGKATRAYFGLLDDVAVLSGPEEDCVGRDEHEAVTAVDRRRRRLHQSRLTPATT